MKPQILIFLALIWVILFIVYPSGDESVQDAKDRLLSQSDEQSNESASEISESSSDEEDTSEIQEDNIPESQDDEATWMNDDSLIVDALLVSDLELPSFVEYGDAVATSDASFVYNQVRGLEIFRENIEQELTCDDLTEFLTARLSSWYFWNTCRFIDGERGLKFNVLRLSGDEYIYERHYIDSTAWIYWVLELERGEGIDKDMLPEKNTEFRDKEFPLIQIGDGLMREILRNN